MTRKEEDLTSYFTCDWHLKSWFHKNLISKLNLILWKVNGNRIKVQAIMYADSTDDVYISINSISQKIQHVHAINKSRVKVKYSFINFQYARETYASECKHINRNKQSGDSLWYDMILKKKYRNKCTSIYYHKREMMCLQNLTRISCINYS